MAQIIEMPHKIDMDGLKYAPESWTLGGFATYDEEKGQESLIISSSNDIGTELPLVAVGPLLQTGFAKWNKNNKSLLTEALERGSLYITRQLDFPTGNSTLNMRNGIRVKTIVRRSEGGAIELESTVDRTGTYIQGSETPHILTGHAFLLYENFEEAQIKAKMTTTWQYATKDGEDSNKQAVYSVRRSVEKRSDMFGEVLVAIGEGETLYSA